MAKKIGGAAAGATSSLYKPTQPKPVYKAPIKPAPKPAAPPVQPVVDPFDTMKQAFTQSDLVKAGLDWDSANPFSNFFNADKVRQAIKAKYQPDFQRETNTLNADDASFRRDEEMAFKDNMSSLQQNAINNGMLFGGARAAQERKLTTTRQGSLDDYLRKLNDAKFNLERQQNRTVDTQFNIEKDIATQEQQDRKRKDLTSRFNIPGYNI